MREELKIALCGEVRTGKSTVADHLEYKYFMVPFAFGDELKKDFHYRYPHVPRSPKPVEGYQLFGQLKRYVHGDDYWINRCFADIYKIGKIARQYNITGSEVGFRPLVTDVRQPNELERLREEGYTIIRIKAPLHERKERMAKKGDIVTDKNLSFETEVHVKDFEVDYEIVNDGSLEELFAKVDDVIDTLMKK